MSIGIPPPVVLVAQTGDQMSPLPAFASHLRQWPANLLCVAAFLASASCSESSPTESAPFDPPGTHQSALTNLGGTGTGGVSVTTRAVPQAYFTADIKVRMHGARPNTAYTVQRAPEVGRAAGSDGVCQRALAIAPWSQNDPPAPSFLTFLQPDGVTPFTLTTTSAGDGSLDFTFVVPTVPAGTHFDVMFRVLDDVVAPTSVFLSGCFTVIVL